MQPRLVISKQVVFLRCPSLLPPILFTLDVTLSETGKIAL